MFDDTVKAVFFDLGETLVTKPRKWLPGAQAVLSSLRFKGFRLGLISNTDKLSRNELLDLLPIDFSYALFEPTLILLSSEVGIKKPDIGIFELAIQRAALPASRCLFCTENLLDTLVAQGAGMRVARIQASDIETLLDQLSRSGMLGSA